MAIAILAPVKAQKPSDTIFMKQLVVLKAQRLEYKKTEFNGQVNIIDSRQINMPLSRTLPESLQGISGLYVQRTNLGGGSVFMRGLTGNQVLIMVDGIRMNNAIYRYGPNQYLNTVNVFDVSSVETYQGSGSVSFGSDALGGTINIISKSADFSEKKTWTPFGQLRFEYPSSSQTALIGTKYSTNNIALTVNGTLRKFNDVQPGGGKPSQAPSGYQEGSSHAKMRVMGKKSEWTIAHQGTIQRNVPNYYRYALENYQKYIWLHQGRMLNYVRNIYHSSHEYSRTLTFAHVTQWEDRSYKKKISDPLTYEKDAVQSFHLNAEWRRAANSGWQRVYTIELYHDRVSSQRHTTDSNGTVKSLRGLYPQGALQSNASASAMFGKNIGRWNINSGLRLSLNNLIIPDVQLGSSLEKKQLQDWQYAYAGTISIGRKFKNAYYYTAVNTGYRIPNVDDLGTLGLVDFRYEQPAYNLNPERNIMMEQGFNYTKNKLSLSVSAYVNELYGLINRVKVPGVFVNSYQVYEKVNTGRARVFGSECSVNYQFNKQFSAKIQGSWQRGDVLKPMREPMRRIPPMNGALVVEWAKGSWYSGLQLLASQKQTRLAPGDISDNRIGPNGTPGWMSIQCWISKTLNNGMVLNFAAQNINNAYYKTHGSGIWMPGRSFRFFLSF
ncbi:MAG: TonB-dependent receptor plug domain-containing protein [Bacteroidetes bacterium]|nr:TonB-dependent receptor plug domain-containing protein [Bacteroidota bacterium]